MLGNAILAIGTTDCKSNEKKYGKLFQPLSPSLVRMLVCYAVRVVEVAGREILPYQVRDLRGVVL